MVVRLLALQSLAYLFLLVSGTALPCLFCSLVGGVCLCACTNVRQKHGVNVCCLRGPSFAFVLRLVYFNVRLYGLCFAFLSHYTALLPFWRCYSCATADACLLSFFDCLFVLLDWFTNVCLLLYSKLQEKYVTAQVIAFFADSSRVCLQRWDLRRPFGVELLLCVFSLVFGFEPRRAGLFIFCSKTTIELRWRLTAEQSGDFVPFLRCDIEVIKKLK